MTAPAPDRRCGTCKWWERYRTNSEYGRCEVLLQMLPFWAHVHDSNDHEDETYPTRIGSTKETAGTDCAMWSDGAEALGEVSRNNRRTAGADGEGG